MGTDIRKDDYKFSSFLFMSCNFILLELTFFQVGRKTSGRRSASMWHAGLNLIETSLSQRNERKAYDLMKYSAPVSIFLLSNN